MPKPINWAALATTEQGDKYLKRFVGQSNEFTDETSATYDIRQLTQTFRNFSLAF